MKVLSDWRSVRLWESRLEQELRRSYDLRLHGFAIGTAILLLMWGVSHLQMRLGVDSLALRYALTLGAGYGAYLLLLRWWAERLVRRNMQFDPDLMDPGMGSWPSTQGSAATLDAGGLPHLRGGALDLVAGMDEGAVVVVPVVAIFLIGLAIVFGAGSLVLLYFGWDALLAVAVELAFSYVSARAAVRIAREGWLAVAVRLSWKPLLGALFCAVLLGAAIDHFMPQVHSLPAAVRVLLGR
ncbi:hypothetical protein AB4Z46_30275 [Variovorax sp. M-6]|uniref:hypothetical protein n=1 Tax=Variovorax sp. M-6 TaxID=3233041 RepID=UPI003F9C351A